MEQERHLIHDRFVAQIDAMSGADLERPVRDFNPQSSSDNPVKQTIIGDAYSHYDEHLPWIRAIVEGRD